MRFGHDLDRALDPPRKSVRTVSHNTRVFGHGGQAVRQLGELRAAGETADPRDAQVERLKQQVEGLKKRVAARDEQLAELTEFKTLAISRLAAQHDEIERLRTQIAEGSSLRVMPTARDNR
ncbi:MULTISPECIES: hypothetical protein [unclassified Streptomyces]|uniref:hypothetical protein n=1 Tax=unclassified Streptomyces TaxID=2593676 RepID=UPI002254CE9A|nr:MULTISPECIES: hypothetical protein [unclassified Streptomyces]MCX4406149.1 hypothetical protein [Streptomyces sp. NBC_01764]MCX5189327.1 hypothetical protein [Streptomyces sp. NBC_00268]